MTSQATLGHWGGVEHVPGEGLDDDPTPRGAVRAVLGEVVKLYADDEYRMLHSGAHIFREWFEPSEREVEPVRVLDVGAGYGCWSSEIRKLAVEQGWPVHITGVELNPEREQHLAKWCDEVFAPWDWREWCAWAAGPGDVRTARGGDFDLVIGNVPFAHVLRQGKGPNGERTDYMPVDETMVPTLLRHAPAVLLLHTAGAFDDSEHGREVWRRYPPAAVWLCGRLSFRAGSATDSRTYYATLWLRGHEGLAQLHMLPTLAPEDRRWTVTPGSEDAATARALGLPMVGE